MININADGSNAYKGVVMLNNYMSEPELAAATEFRLSEHEGRVVRPTPEERRIERLLEENGNWRELY